MSLLRLNFPAPSELVSRVSVRARIIAIAIVPVIGFLANGLAFTVGESEVDTAFRSAQQADLLADASREFKVALTTMRMSAKEFAAHPSYDLVNMFGTAHDAALKSLDTVEANSEADRRANLGILRVKVDTLKSSFSSLIHEQEELGFAESEGLHERLTRAGQTVERIINEDLTYVAESEAKKLLISLLTLRRYEVQYRQNRIEFVRQRFAEEVTNFHNLFGAIDGDSPALERLKRQIDAYADVFAQWALASSKVRPWVVNIDTSSERMLPDADQIIASARERSSLESRKLSASQQRTKIMIVS
jgi:methyl-accepting chemotaxis protein